MSRILITPRSLSSGGHPALALQGSLPRQGPLPEPAGTPAEVPEVLSQAVLLASRHPHLPSGGRVNAPPLRNRPLLEQTVNIKLFKKNQLSAYFGLSISN